MAGDVPSYASMSEAFALRPIHLGYARAGARADRTKNAQLDTEHQLPGRCGSKSFEVLRVA